jgi:hypothetical protein
MGKFPELFGSPTYFPDELSHNSVVLGDKSGNI